MYSQLTIVLAIDLFRNSQGLLWHTGQKSHYPSGNHHASHFLKCPISRLYPPANHGYWWPFTCWRSVDNQSDWPSAWVDSRWLGLGNRRFLDVACMVVTWWIVAGFAQWNLLTVAAVIYKCFFLFFRIIDEQPQLTELTKEHMSSYSILKKL